MTFVPSSEAARNHLNAAKAEALLAMMDAMEEVAQVCEEQEIDAIRQRLAVGYAQVVGVEPERRAVLRARLDLIARNGHQSVEDILAALR